MINVLFSLHIFVVSTNAFSALILLLSLMFMKRALSIPMFFIQDYNTWPYMDLADLSSLLLRSQSYYAVVQRFCLLYFMQQATYRINLFLFSSYPQNENSYTNVTVHPICHKLLVLFGGRWFRVILKIRLLINTDNCS